MEIIFNMLIKGVDDLFIVRETMTLKIGRGGRIDFREKAWNTIGMCHSKRS